MMAEDARFEYLEGRVEEQARNWDRLFEYVGRIDQKVDMVGAALSARIDGLNETLQARFGAIDARFTSIDARFTSIDTRFTSIDVRCNAIEAKIDARCDALDRKIDARCDALDRKFDDLRSELSKQFRWTMGIMITLATGVLTAVLAH